MDAAVVELDALADSVGARTEDQHLLAVAGADLVIVLVGGVVVRGLGFELGPAGVNGLEGGDHPSRDACLSDLGLGRAPQVGELGVAEPEPLGPPPGPPVHAGQAGIDQHRPLIGYERHLVEEPRVDLGPVVDDVEADPPPDGRFELEHAVRGGQGRCGDQLLVGQIVVDGLGGIGVEAEPSLFQRSQSLLERLGERPPDGHRLADRLHLGAEHRGLAGELLERPARHLGDHVVDGRFEAGRGLAGDVVGDLVEGVAHRQTGRDLGDREPGGLGGQGAGPADPGIHLDDDHVAVERIEGELDIGPARLHPYPANAGEGGVTHPLVLDVGKGLGRSHRDRVAGVNTHGVDVLDGADDHAVVGAVTHDLELVLLPPRDALLDEDLGDGAGVEAVGGHPLELLGGRGDAGAFAAQDVGGSDDDGQADLGHHPAGGLHGRRHLLALGGPLHFSGRSGDARGRDLEADADHRLLEPFTIFGGGDGFGIGTDQLHAEALQYPGLHQFHGQVQGGLASQGGKQGVGAFLLDDAGEDLDV